jgi:hypothetical protein
MASIVYETLTLVIVAPDGIVTLKSVGQEELVAVVGLATNCVFVFPEE